MSKLLSWNFYFNVGSTKEDIFSGHHLSSVFQSSLHITITNFLWDFLKAAMKCIPVYNIWVLQGFCLLFCALSLIQHTSVEHIFIAVSFLFRLNHINNTPSGIQTTVGRWRFLWSSLSTSQATTAGSLSVETW